MREPATRTLTVIAQDPSLRDPSGRIVRDRAVIPAEPLERGPRGYRVAVVDYDSSKDVLYAPADLGANDRFEDASDEKLLGDPAFHSQNVYAIVMRTLARFEFALGRRVPWGFYGHQLQVAPHAFVDANAFYSEADHGLCFGYFPGPGDKPIFTCLSHDVVAHETSHAILDGLRDHFTDPSLPDQAGFHEGFGDVVALLSVLSLPRTVETLLSLSPGTKRGWVEESKLQPELLRRSVLFRLAEEMGQEIAAHRGQALRASLELAPDPQALRAPAFEEPHVRGEILVSAVLGAFLEVWHERISKLEARGRVPVNQVVEQGAEAANTLLTMAIRGLDYCPPVDLSYGDFLAGLLTADRELVVQDTRYGYRDKLRKHFQAWGVRLDAPGQAEPGLWAAPDAAVDYRSVHLDALRRDPDEVFRFLWQNRKALRVHEDAYTRVISVRPCVRVGPDGFVLNETVCEYVQQVDLAAAELSRFGVQAPKGMPKGLSVRLYGGGTLLFDDFGQLKYHVRKRLDAAERQQAKLDYLWETGTLQAERLGVSDGAPAGQRFAQWHRRRSGQYQRSF